MHRHRNQQRSTPLIGQGEATTENTRRHPIRKNNQRIRENHQHKAGRDCATETDSSETGEFGDIEASQLQENRDEGDEAGREYAIGDEVTGSQIDDLSGASTDTIQRKQSREGNGNGCFWQAEASICW